MEYCYEVSRWAYIDQERGPAKHVNISLTIHIRCSQTVEYIVLLMEDKMMDSEVSVIVDLQILRNAQCGASLMVVRRNSFHHLSTSLFQVFFCSKYRFYETIENLDITNEKLLL